MKIAFKLSIINSFEQWSRVGLFRVQSQNFHVDFSFFFGFELHDSDLVTDESLRLAAVDVVAFHYHFYASPLIQFACVK
jgi:hypothetical protein